MKIRYAVETDFTHIAAIHIESWKDAYANVLPAEFITEKLDRELARHWKDITVRDEDLILVAEEDALVGFIAIWCRAVPFIDNLHVKPRWRSKKVGSALMRAAVKELIHRGHKKAYLWVFESNEKAIRFYEKLGGRQKERAGKNIFGYEIPSIKIEWDDINL